MDIKTKINQALTLQNQKQFNEADTLFQTVLKESPNNPDALHGLGLSLAMQRQYQAAIPFFLQAIHAAPSIPAFHNNLANTYKALGELDEAQKHYRQALSLKSNYPEVYNNLGNLLVQKGDLTEAISHFQKALRLNPDAIDAHYNLANCYLRVDRLSEAVPHFETVLTAWPTHLGAHHNLGITLCALKQFSTAEPHLRFVVEVEPNNVDALFHLALIENSLHQFEAARKHYEQAIQFKPDYAEAHHNLATLLLQLNDKSGALKHFREALTQMPENKTAAHMINALTQSHATGAPTDYVRSLFDQYAYNYEQHVKEKLEYRVPELLRNTLTPFAKQKSTPWEVLDLGCGSGLLAPYVTDIAEKLYGVDISSNMIHLAQEKGAYLKLFTEDIVDFLTRTSLAFDVIIAADVFVYFGELNTLFQLIHQRLKANGLLCFSIEALETTASDYTILPSGRFAHHPDYIKKLIKRSFTIESMQPAVIRKQEDQNVAGYIYVLRKKH